MFGIDIKTHFKISSKHKNGSYDRMAIQLRKNLLKLICNHHELQWEYADKVIEHWNNFDINDKRFQRPRTNRKDTKTYVNAVIAISHCLIYPAGSRLQVPFEAIDRLKIAHHYKKSPWTWRGNITVEKFFCALEDPVYSAYLNSDIEFKRFIYQYHIRRDMEGRINIAYARFKEMYAKQFYSKNIDKGNNICYQFEGMIKKWLCNVIDEIRSMKNSSTHYRNMEGYSLIEDRIDEYGIPTPPLLQRYFFHFYHKYDRNPKITQLTQYEEWFKFIDEHMRIEVGLNNFYKVMPKT
jgi:hypothetical protein